MHLIKDRPQGYNPHPINQTLQGGPGNLVFNKSPGGPSDGGKVNNSDLVQTIHLAGGETEAQKGGVAHARLHSQRESKPGTRAWESRFASAHHQGLRVKRG